MFETVVRELLAGRFVCGTTLPDGFRWLSDEGGLEETEAFVTRLGLSVATTASANVYYLRPVRMDEAAKNRAKEVFSSVTGILRPTVDFMTLAMTALEDDTIPAEGAVINADRLIGQLSARPALQDVLQRVHRMIAPGSAGANWDQRLVRILKKLEEHGILKETNSERRTYVVTGKIDYVLEAMAFVASHEAIDLEGADEIVQGTLI